MKATQILDEEISDKRISSLPTRPTASVAYGGKGYSSIQMKAAFDALPLFIIERLNLLLEDISREDADSIAGEIKTGIAEGHTLAQLCESISDGTVTSLIPLENTTLSVYLSTLRSDLDRVLGALGLKSGGNS